MDDSLLLKSTYHDNPFLKDEDRDQIEWLKKYNYNQYRVYALGEWGLSENNNPWLFAFDRERHLKEELDFLPAFPVYLSFDFNRQPVTCVAVQMSPHRGARDSFVHFIKEFTGDMQLHELCAYIKASFPASILHVTGDASGSRGDVGFTRRHDTYYQMIASYFNLPLRQLNLNSHNMDHHDSRLLVNTLLHEYPNIYISQKDCPTLANDCMVARVDDTSSKPGMLKKDRGIYKMDSFDAFRYFFQTYFADFVNKVRLVKRIE